MIDRVEHNLAIICTALAFVTVQVVKTFANVWVGNQIVTVPIKIFTLKITCS